MNADEYASVKFLVMLRANTHMDASLVCHPLPCDGYAAGDYCRWGTDDDDA